ncbi:MAG: hypothetical protein LBE74_08575 [Treponema sp.]|jgi:hypothetical protein|nr:hypothetical protein [Treponema sp.]
MKNCILQGTALKTKAYVVLLIAGMSFALFSCATKPDVYAKMDAAISAGDYASAVAAINEAQAIPEGKDKAANPIYQANSAILLYLDRGVLEYYAGNFEESTKDLEEAERLIEEAFTKSVTQEIGSYLANDNVKDYAGETYEDLYINVFNALNYYANGDVEGAGVEVRRMTEKLAALEGTAEEGGFEISDLMTFFAEAVKIAEQGGLTLGIDLPAPSPVRDLQVAPGDPGADFMQWVQADAGKKIVDSALARYLSAVFYRGMGNDDDARIDFEALSQNFGFDVGEESDIPSGKARINVIGFAGLSPVKTMYKQTISLDCFPTISEAAEKALAVDPTLGVGWAAVPVLVPRASAIDKVEITVNGETVTLNLLEDIGGLMKSTLAEKFDDIYYKAYIQAAVRYIAVEVAGKQAKEKAGNSAVADAAVKVAIVGAKKGADALAQADVRSVRYFPSKAYAGGVTMDPGEYTITVNYYAGGSKVGSVEKKINAKAGKANIVDATCLK